MLRQVEQDLSNWSLKHFSWFGRAAIVKMTTLLRLLYFFHMLQIDIPASFLNSYKEYCGNLFRHIRNHVSIYDYSWNLRLSEA